MNKSFKKETLDPLDPIEAARIRGKIYGIGASGKFKKTVITRIGFGLLGFPFLVGGVIMFFSFVSIFNTADEFADVLAYFGFLAFGIVLAVLGFFLVRNAITK